MIEKLNKEIKSCQLCSLCKSRNRIVLGHGNINSKIIFIGEAPGKEEDKKGIPFIGKSGKILTDAIEKAGFKREDFYITNIVKCRPPENKTPKKKKSKNVYLFKNGN